MKELKINPPEGYEIDKENSTFEKIVFKKVEEKLTYDDIAEKLFICKNYYYTNDFGTIVKIKNKAKFIACSVDPNNAPTYNQLARLLALNKLMNTAYYLNDGWEPNWNDKSQHKYFIYYNNSDKSFTVDVNFYFNNGVVYFKSIELAIQAKEILGEETLKLALGVC